MNRTNCSCCNRSFQSSQLRHHGVGGGVRAKNELLCADCWKVFSSEAWEDSAKPESGKEEQIFRKRKLQHSPATISREPGVAAPGRTEGNSNCQAPEKQGDPLDQLRRLSGAGFLHSGSAFARAALQKQVDLAGALTTANSTQVPAEDKGSGAKLVTEPLKRAGSALARDRSGRFIGKSKPAAKTESRGTGQGGPNSRGNIDPDDPLEQDLMVSQAHLFDDAPAYGPAESQNPQASQNTGKAEGSGEVLSPAAPVQVSSPMRPHAARVRSALSDTDCIAELKQIRSKVSSLEQSLLAAQLQTLCIMCKAAARSTVARPCGHVLYCAPCMAARVAASGICPECSSPIAETQTVILVGP